MNQRIVVVTSDGHSREDGNVYYSRYLLVQSDTLAFDEPIFDEPHVIEGDTADERMDAVPAALRGLGYVVVDVETAFVTTTDVRRPSLDDIIKGVMGRNGGV